MKDYGPAEITQDFGSVFDVAGEGGIAIFERDGIAQSVWFECPCGCGSHCHTPLQPNDEGQCWSLTQHDDGRVTLSPSVLYTFGCRAHFFIQNSRAVMCADSGAGREHESEGNTRNP